MTTVVLTCLYLIIGYAWAEVVKTAMAEEKKPIHRWSILYYVALVFWPVAIVLGILCTLQTEGDT